MKCMEVVLKISTDLPCLMFEKVLMTLVEVGFCLIPALLPPIIQFIMVDHMFLIVTVIIEVDIGITPANILHITMVD